jgi:hypothetical protein
MAALCNACRAGCVVRRALFRARSRRRGTLRREWPLDEGVASRGVQTEA